MISTQSGALTHTIGVQARSTRSAGSRLNQLRCSLAPKIGRAVFTCQYKMDLQLQNGLLFLERLGNPGKVKPDQVLQKQRIRVAKALSVLSSITDIGILASAVASLFVPGAQIATITFALLTLSLRKLSKVTAQLMFDTQQQRAKKFVDHLPVKWCLDTAICMRAAGIKYVETPFGLVTKTELLTHAYKTAQSTPLPPEPDQRLRVQQLRQHSEALLRQTLAGKANKRDFKTIFRQQSPMLSGVRVSANQVKKGFGTVGSLLPMVSENPNDSVLGLLEGNYKSHSSRPDIKFTLRNLAWNSSNNPKDWVNLLYARSRGDAIESDADLKHYLERHGIKENEVDLFCTGSMDSLVKAALASFSAADKARYERGQIQAMSPASQAVVHIANQIERQRSLP